jgi:hypothetical protein
MNNSFRDRICCFVLSLQLSNNVCFISDENSPRPMQEKMVIPSPMTNFHMVHADNVTPFSISMQQPNQQCQVPEEGLPSSVTSLF